MVDKWIQGSIEHEGRTKTYLMRTYGNKAFHMDGRIKSEYLDKAIMRAKAEGNTSLERALLEAKTLKRLGRMRRKRRVMV